MSSVRDALGNVVKEGDLVTIELSSKQLVVRVGDIRGGSGIVASIAGVKDANGVVSWDCTGLLAFDPKSGVVPGMLKLHQPSKVSTQ